jgi:hypothetical protein
MKLKAFILVIFIISIAAMLISYAAEPEFTLLAKSGSVEYKANKKSWKPIATKQEFGLWDMIKIPKGGYACLIYKDGETLELTAKSKQIELTVSEMKKKLKGKSSDISSKFAEYVVDEMSDTDDFFSNDDYHDDMSTTGAVNRAHRKNVDTQGELSNMTGDDETSGLLNAVGSAFLGSDDSFIVTRLPGNSYVMDKKIHFTWYSNPHVKVYSIHFTDRNNKELLKENVLDTSIVLDFSSVNIIKGENYYWHVTDKKGERKSDEYCLQWISKNEEEIVLETVDKIFREFGGEESPLANLAVAKYYADRNIMNRAMELYRKAIEIAPGVQEFELIYAKYLDRIGLTDEAKQYVRR